MSTGPAGGGYHTSEDEQILHRLGYAQELFRAMGGFQNFAISFTIISILAGCLTSYLIAFNKAARSPSPGAGSSSGLMSTIIALAMAEIASAYPTAGGLYYWASKLGSPALGLVHGLVQPRRARSQSPQRSATGSRSSRRRSSTSGSSYPNTNGVDAPRPTPS